MQDITENFIRQQLKTKVFGRRILYKEEIDSTNTEAKRQAFEENHGLLVIAEKQTLGKGRRGRSWDSPKGTGIWMSLLLQPKKVPSYKASMLTLITALSVVEAIFEVTGLKALIKWPNDIVVNGRKVCGILTEMSADNDGIRHIIIGIGINVNTEEFPDEIREMATSLFLEQKKAELINRAVLVAAVLKKLEAYYEQFLAEEELGFLLEAYNKNLINLDRQVKVLGCDGREECQGTARGINKKGELLVETEEGLISVRSGEVSVRGLYGYV